MSDLDVAADVGGVDGGSAPPPPVPMNERPADGPGSGRSAIRKELEKSVESARKAEQPAKKAPARAARQMQEEAAAAAGEVEAEGEVEAPAEGAASQYKAPEGWSREAKATWEALPPEVQAAVAKRETDMAKGVEELKKRQAEIDQVLQPRMETIRRHGHSPAQAVNQLFSWFEALSQNPQVAFPALANSFKFDLRNIPGLVPQQQEVQQQVPPQQEAQAAQQGAPDIPPQLLPYFQAMHQQMEQLKQGFSQQLGQLSTSFQAQTQAKTEEILHNWAKDKPHFEEVRKTMARLIASGEVAPLPNGTADLDRAYDMALWALPDIRQKILEDQQHKAQEAAKAKQLAERKAQQDQADKARRAQAGSLSPSAPGMPGSTPKAKKGRSVRESIAEAMKELSE